MLSKTHTKIARRSTPRRRFNYASVTATLALVFAMSGGALAASHYVITSTKQLSPKVLKALKGNKGSRGATGKEGPPGKPGPQGKEGKAGAPSDGYGISKPNPTGAAIPLGSSYTTVASETVPAGNYYAVEDVEFNGTTGSYAFCYLVATPTSGTVTYVDGGDILADDHTDGTSVSASASGLITTPAQTVLRIQCASIGAGAASIQRANLTALAVGAVH
jgi:hypothetical protein